MKQVANLKTSIRFKTICVAFLALLGLVATTSGNGAILETLVPPLRFEEMAARHVAVASNNDSGPLNPIASPTDGRRSPGPESAAIEPVTLSVKDMEITELLQMFSRSRKLNIVSGEGVTGKVSIELHEVPFEQALSAVAAMVGCQAAQIDNIYFIDRISETDGAKTALKQVRTFRLDYAVPSEIEVVVREMLSERGRVTSYKPLRSVVVEDRPDVLDRVAKVVESLDLPPRQVLIEARIMEARISKDMRFGVDWSLLLSRGKGSGDINVEGFTTPEGLSREGLFVSWGEGDFQAAIEGLEGIEELNTLAAPRLLAVDGTEAEIIIGGELGFSVVTTVDNTVIQSVEFLDTGTQLRITPTIAADGHILMHIHPELSNGVIQENLPSKTTAEVTTDVLIKDGHTLFIGGLIRERTENVRKGVPLLMRIPVLGVLFGKTIQSREKTELVTLITPRIIQPGQKVDY